MGRRALVPEASSTGVRPASLAGPLGPQPRVWRHRVEQLAFAPRVQVLDASVTHDDATVSLLLLATLRKKQVAKEERAEAKARKHQ